MKSVPLVLDDVKKRITSEKEKGYFWTHQVRYAVILESVEELSKGEKLRVLDIGCFPYHIGLALEILGHDVYGIASEHEPIKKKNIKVLNIEKDKFPFEDNFFDIVLYNEVIEHLVQSPVIPLTEVYRITKKNGYCMVTTPNIARSINRAKLLLGKTIMFPFSAYFENNGKGNNIYHRHNREYVLSELKTLFQKTGWSIEKSGYFISYTPFRKRLQPDSLPLFLGKCINYCLMQVVSSLQDTLIVVGRK